MGRRRRDNAARSHSSEGLWDDVKFVLKQEQAANLVPAAFLVFGILDAVPIPTDAGYFAVQNWLNKNKEHLSSRQFWFYQALNYYSWDVAWYMSLFLATYFGGKTVGQKATIGIAIISFGAIVAEILSFSGHDPKAMPEPQQALPAAPSPTPTSPT